MTDKNVIDIEDVRVNRLKKKKRRQKKPLSLRQRQQKRRKFITSLAIVFLLMSTLGYSLYKIVSLQIEKNKLKEEQQMLKEERDRLEVESKNVESLDYIEQQAREQLHLVLPGEILYILPEEEQGDNKK